MVHKLVMAALTVVTIGLVGAANIDTVAALDVPGNNGTLKVHEKDTPSGTESNDPKVCSFNLEAYGLDAGQTGTIEFDVQGGDGPTGVPAGPFSFGPANADGYYATEYYELADGHYKATLYGKDVGSSEEAQVEEKAKSKVFKVDCEPEEEPGVPGSAVSLVCPVNTYTLTVSNTGEAELAVEVNGVERMIAVGGAAITADFNVGDVLTVKVDDTPVTVEGKVLNNFKLQTCQGMGTTTTTTSTNPPSTNASTAGTAVVASSGFGSGAATGVASLPVTSADGAQVAAMVVSFGSIIAAAGAYAIRARDGMAL